jgi:threonine/homoserine/homoserine lactone efflux protein
MPSDRWLAWLLFAFVMAITPGPNNVMLMSSGARFGVRRTNPHCLGVALGFGAMFLLVEVGVGAALAASPALLTAMKGLSIAFVGWIAWSIATAPVTGRAGDEGAVPERRDASPAGAGASASPRRPAAASARPLGFLGGAAFQWVNPKAWMICIGAVGTYVPPDTGVVLLAAMAAALALVTYLSGGTWVVFGRALREALHAPARQRAFNLAMAALLVASVVPTLRD